MKIKVAESFGLGKRRYEDIYGIIIQHLLMIYDQVKVYPKVTPEGHGEEILKFLRDKGHRISMDIYK